MKKLLPIITCLLVCSIIIEAETVSVSDLKDVILQAVTDYKSNPNRVMTLAEIKDLIEVYFSFSGDTVEVSGEGFFSKEDLVIVYNKAKSSKCVKQCAGKFCGDDGCGGVCGICSEGKLCVKDECLISEDLSLRNRFEKNIPLGEKRVYVIDINDTDINDTKRVSVFAEIGNLNTESDVEFYWVMPNGRILPDDSYNFDNKVTGTSEVGKISLKSKSFYETLTAEKTLNYEYIPPGRHLLIIQALKASSISIYAF